jgi:Kef-type K+ transport system membrane component KefB
MGGEHELAILILTVGGLMALTIFVRAGLRRVHVPPLVGFMVIGLGLRMLYELWGGTSQTGRELLEFLSDLGVICLLFRVGLESDLGGLIRQLSRASVAWVATVVVSFAAGLAVSFYLLQLGFTASLFIATALTATSVGVPVRLWQRRKALDSPSGELLLDVAEMDDISGVVFMAVLFAVAPVLAGPSHASLVPVLGKTVGWVLLKLAAFAAACYAFSRLVESHLTHLCEKLAKPPAPMIVVVGMGFIFAAVAGMLGFSVAIGAFFAGLVFSRDPESVKIDANFESLYELFYPFFFIGIGFLLPPQGLLGGAAWGGVLLMAAVLGKWIPAAGAVWPLQGLKPAVLIGVSMVPRAEITMIIMQRGLKEGLVPDQAYSGMVFVSAVTCVGAALLLVHLLDLWKPGQTA